MNAHKPLVVWVILQYPFYIVRLADDLEVALALLNGLEEIIHVGESLDFEVIIVQFVEMDLEFTVSSNLGVTPVIWHLLNELLL